MKLKLSLHLAVLALVGLLSACYYRGPEYYEELDIVYTNYDKDYSFKAHKTYFMPDKIVKITGALQNGQSPEFVSASTAAIIFNEIKSNMSGLGFNLVSDTASADLVLFPTALEVTNITYYYDYWYAYYGWYYPPYYGGWYYPYGGYTTSYQTGTLMMNLIDNKDLSPTNKARVVWTGAVNGLLEGTTSDVNQRIVKSVDQAFKQSEYLR